MTLRLYSLPLTFICAGMIRRRHRWLPRVVDRVFIPPIERRKQEGYSTGIVKCRAHAPHNPRYQSHPWQNVSAPPNQPTPDPRHERFRSSLIIYNKMRASVLTCAHAKPRPTPHCYMTAKPSQDFYLMSSYLYCFIPYIS